MADMALTQSIAAATPHLNNPSSLTGFQSVLGSPRRRKRTFSQRTTLPGLLLWLQRTTGWSQRGGIHVGWELELMVEVHPYVPVTSWC
uniref:Uncharacterized protein n=1 Tax=Oryzias latipes TaxID=8090 RepID=A0A3P9JEB0_ORYLA